MLRNLFNHVLHKARFRPLLHCNTIKELPNSRNMSKTLDLEVNRIVWFDLEMTGLDIETDKILEIACLVTDTDLNIIAEGPNLILHEPKEVLENMGEWCIKQHGKSGLTEASLKSTLNVNQAEIEIKQFLEKHVTEKTSPIAGNSVYMDRIIDVSTVKELCRRWNTEIYKQAPKKQFTHRALDDIKESVNEMKYYKTTFFKTI